MVLSLFPCASKDCLSH